MPRAQARCSLNQRLAGADRVSQRETQALGQSLPSTHRTSQFRHTRPSQYLFKRARYVHGVSQPGAGIPERSSAGEKQRVGQQGEHHQCDGNELCVSIQDEKDTRQPDAHHLHSYEQHQPKLDDPPT
jgi:hypothetical protein